MALPKHNYERDEFYDEILALALNGNTDAEIADALDLEPETFNRMKNGKYDGWDKEQNEARSARICQVLTRGRLKILSIIRGRYLKAALGGIKTRNTSKTSRRLKVDGEYTEDEEIMKQETEFESAPNVQALATLLYHWDSDWRAVEKGTDGENTKGNAERGLDISKWIEREMSEGAQDKDGE